MGCKAAGNYRKHKVSFDEALTVFRDPLAAIFDDENHSMDEEREIIIGHSNRNRVSVLQNVQKTLSAFSAHGGQHSQRKRTKRTQASKHRKISADDMLPEYQFNYRKGRRNRFAARMDQAHVIVTLDPDLAEVFPTSKSVNNALRALIRAIPHSKVRLHR